ncbi:protein DinB [Marivirga lumbricoides]|uniref:Protein DinB n=1 Tax=Marivirga lumbricoides TaxID=1046115 RepID=A0ABQ1N1Q4_9BACT|nr:protein DinB [Marivirga lumbricoides]
MKQFFKNLFQYSHQCNQKLADIFNAEPNKTSDKAVKLFNHVLNAHQIWNNRINSTEKLFGVWEIHELKDLKSIDQKNYEQSLQILDQFELDESLNYINSKSKAFSNSVQDILFHIINHSTYHRGQIASEFKQGGLEPLVTDYIFFKR